MVNGFVVNNTITDKLRYGASVIPNVHLFEYSVQFQLTPAHEFSRRLMGNVEVACQLDGLFEKTPPSSQRRELILNAVGRNWSGTSNICQIAGILIIGNEVPSEVAYATIFIAYSLLLSGGRASFTCDFAVSFLLA